MTRISASTHLAELVIARPELAARLDALGLDYCCRGNRPLDAAVAEAGLDLDAVVAELEAAPADAPPEPAWSDVGQLADWIERTHHQYLRRTLPWLSDLAATVRRVHGGNHPELDEVVALVADLRADLEPHLAKEEQVLFPMVRELAAATAAPDFHCGALANPIRVMLAEHDDVGALLARLRERTDAFCVPEDACASYRALYHGLADLEADTHRHVHRENNVLFPAVLAAEQALVDRPVDRLVDRPAVEEGGDAPCWAHLLDEPTGP